MSKYVSCGNVKRPPTKSFVKIIGGGNETTETTSALIVLFKWNGMNLSDKLSRHWERGVSRHVN